MLPAQQLGRYIGVLPLCSAAVRPATIKLRHYPGSLARQKLRLASLARGRLLRAFAGRVGSLDVLSEPDLIAVRQFEKLPVLTQARKSSRHRPYASAFRKVFALLPFVLFDVPEVLRSGFLFWSCLDVSHKRPLARLCERFMRRAVLAKSEDVLPPRQAKSGKRATDLIIERKLNVLLPFCYLTR